MATLFQTYSGKQANGVIANQHPAVFVYPHIGTQSVGMNGQRLQPTERGKWFLRQSRPGGTQPQGAVDNGNNKPSGKSGCGCGGK